MSFTSIAYLLFTAGCAVIYYLIPRRASRYQYFVLLIFSYVFYLLNGPALIFFLLFTTFSTFFARTSSGSVGRPDEAAWERSRE